MNEFPFIRVIRVGKLYRINPSQAFLGIETGIVKVISIVPAETIPEVVNVYTEGMAKDDDERAYWEENNWTIYQYTSTGEIGYLPIELFAEHVSIA